MVQDVLNKVYQHARDTSLLTGSLALLEWDQNTYMPTKAGSVRADQTAYLHGLIHQRKTDAAYGEQLRELESGIASGQLSQVDAANVRGLLRDYEKNIQLPEKLVQATAKATALGQQIWVEAKERQDFQLFREPLAEIISLRKEEASILQKEGFTKYDSLLDQYEEGADSNEIARVFGELRESLVPMVSEAVEAEKRKSSRLEINHSYPIDAQRKLAKYVAEKIGFDFDRGRLDETVHPFCTTLGPHDHRILSRYYEDSYSSGLYGVLHEAGHGMYEQGLRTDMFGLPVGEAASLGVHESQSRLWENAIGRSTSFWQWLYPEACRLLPNLGQATVPQIVADLNRVEPSLIRIEADETTYNLHIFIRFEIERLLINEDLPVEELPALWNDLYESYLGIRPTNDSIGVMQDVHWSAGLIGYFPTYALGNLYSVQLLEAAHQAIPELDKTIAQGDFVPLLDWLRKNVHSLGRTYLPHELMQRACGKPLSSQPFLNYLAKKGEAR